MPVKNCYLTYVGIRCYPYITLTPSRKLPCGPHLFSRLQSSPFCNVLLKMYECRRSRTSLHICISFSSRQALPQAVPKVSGTPGFGALKRTETFSSEHLSLWASLTVLLIQEEAPEEMMLSTWPCGLTTLPFSSLSVFEASFYYNLHCMNQSRRPLSQRVCLIEVVRDSEKGSSMTILWKTPTRKSFKIKVKLKKNMIN